MTYDLLPFRFERLSSGHELITNEAGEFLFAENGTVERVINGNVSLGSDEYKDLITNHIIADDRAVQLLDVLCSKILTQKNHLGTGIALQLVVMTRRCNQSCRYCQISKRDTDEKQYDMQTETINKVVDAIIATSADSFTLEIQGGEPLLVMDNIKYLIKRAQEKVAIAKKEMIIVICTNLTLADNDFYSYCKDNDIYISTSLDGPQDLHNSFRIHPNEDSYTLVIDRIKNAIQELGIDKVSALMTSTKESFAHATDIIDEYIELGLNHIFIRKLSEYGFVRNKGIETYPPEDFLRFYEECLSYIIEKNRKGIYLSEVLATIMLKKILTPYSTGFVDLLSPPGLGTSFIAYDYNGNVYPSDEARMLSAMDDDKFLLGNLHQDAMGDIFINPALKDIHFQAMAEGVPGCVDCVFLPYCGADPVYHYNSQKDIVGNKSRSGFCKVNKTIFKLLFEKIQANDPEEMKVFWSWIRNAPVSDIEKGLPGYD